MIEEIFTYIGIAFIGWAIGKGIESIVKKKEGGKK